MAQLDRAAVPEGMRVGTGRCAQSVEQLALLAVDRGHEGRGLLVHCETDTARAFSRHLVPEFLDSPTDPLHLVLRLN